MPASPDRTTASEPERIDGVPDAELARRIAAGGGAPAGAEEAELCRRYGQRLVHSGRRRPGCDDAARDLAQDVLLLTLRKLRAGFARIDERYELDMDFDSVPGLVERFGLTFPSL